MRHILYIIIGILCLTACQTDQLAPSTARGELVLTLTRGPKPQVQTRAVDADLALTIYNPDGTPYKSYAAGQVPGKIILQADVEYTLRAYSDNPLWASANDGKGEACYSGETTVIVGADEVVYCKYAVPMSNYAVTYTLPDLFNQLFKSKKFTVSGGGRKVTLDAGEKAYFAPSEGFTYQLEATNNDDKTSRHSPLSVDDVEAGKLYNIKYVYETSVNTGGIDIEITDNTEHEDVDISI